jgi:predicted RNA-binding Zn-ribbon protein involved in translation (DUF1610 family)
MRLARAKGIKEMINKCPGTKAILMPLIKLKKCPHCGLEIEFVSTDMKINCPGCGFTIYNAVSSCVQWCENARNCVGEEVHKSQEESHQEIIERR